MNATIKQHLTAALWTTIIGLSIAGFVAFDRVQPIKVDNKTAEPTKIRPGGTIRLGMTGSWNRRCVAEVYRSIIGEDDIVRSYKREWIGPPYDLGKFQEVHQLVVPLDVPTGLVRLRTLLVFRDCGITSQWWTIDIAAPTVEFIILEPSKSSGRTIRPLHRPRDIVKNWP